ncbi:MAG: hypothetical protein ACOYN4_21715 [Bacteroidales bacterium]
MKKICFIIPFLLLCVAMRAQVSPAANNSTGGSATLPNGGYLAWSVGEPIIGTVATGSATVSQGVLQTWPDIFKNLELTLYLEGLFNGTSMNKTKMPVAMSLWGILPIKLPLSCTMQGHTPTLYILLPI